MRKIRNLLPVIAAATVCFSVPARADDDQGEVFPPSRFDVDVRATRARGLESENATMLYLSTRVTLDSGTVAQPHTPIMRGASLVSPQGNLLTAFWDSTRAFAAPHGRNADVVVLTAGLEGAGELSADEKAVHRFLAQREIFEQIAFPLIVSALGLEHAKSWGSEAELAALQGIFIQNWQLIESLRAGERAGDFGSAVWQFLYRDYQSLGPVTRAVAKRLGMSAEKLARRLLRDSMTHRLRDLLNPLEKLESLANAAGNIATIEQVWDAIDDMRSTPARLEFRVLFRKGVGSVWPGHVRQSDERAAEFTVRGYGFRSDPPPTVAFFAGGRGHAIHAARPDRVFDSRQMTVSLPMTALRGVEASDIWLQVRWKRERHFAPEPIRYTRTLELHGMEPGEGHAGQEVRLHGTYSPYVVTHELFFEGEDGRKLRARISRISRETIWAIVPDGVRPTRSERWKVWVREHHGGDRAAQESRDRPATFTSLPKHWKTVQREHREWMEREFEVKGTIPAGARRARVPLALPAGAIQTEAWLAELRVPRGDPRDGKLGTWGLTKPTRRPDGSIYHAWLGRYASNVEAGQPNDRATYTTPAPTNRPKRYGLLFNRRNPVELRYRVKVRTRYRGDLGSPHDAGATPETAMELPVLQHFNAYLYGEPARATNTDRTDWYRISGVDADQEVRVKLTGIVGASSGTPSRALKSLTLCRRVVDGSGGSDLVDVDKREGPLEPDDYPATLRASHTQPADYYFRIEHESGDVEYHLEALVQPKLEEPPPEPIESRFDRDAEAWRVTVSERELDEEIYEQAMFEGGHLHSRDRPRKGRLDLVLLFDITESMNRSIANVHRSARSLVESLSERCPDMRVGIAGYADLGVTPANRLPMFDLSPDPNAQMRRLGTIRTAKGGDFEEDTLEGVDRSLRLGWRTDESVARVLVVIGDAPAKVTKGKDRDGRSIAAVTADARRRGVRIYSLFVNNNNYRTEQARRDFEALAERTGGRMIRVDGRSLGPDVGQRLAEPILSATLEAVDAVSPRYWKAPAKFLGNKERYYGSCLSFRVRGSGRGTPIAANDIRLVGRKGEITFRGRFMPRAADIDKTDSFRRYAISLATVSGWRTSSGSRANEWQIRDVLRDLRAIYIRAEFRSGVDRCMLDDVVFGDPGPATDVSPDDWVRAYLDSIERSREIVRGNIRKRFGAGIRPRLRSLMKKQGVRRPQEAAERFETHIASTGILSDVRRALTENIDRWLGEFEARIRARGEVPDSYKDVYKEGGRMWKAAQADLEEQLGKILDACVARAALADRLDAAGAQQDELQRRLAAQRNIEQVHRRTLLAKAHAVPLPEWPE